MDESLSLEDVTSTQLTNGCVAESGGNTDEYAEEIPTKMAGAAISKCEPPDADNNAVDAKNSLLSPAETDKDKNSDAVCSKSTFLSPSETGKDASEPVEDNNSILSPPTTETMNSFCHSKVLPQDNLITSGDTKELAEGGDSLGKTDDNSGQIGKLAQEGSCRMKDTKPADIAAGDTSSAVEDKPPATKDTESGEKIEEKYEGKPSAFGNGTTIETKTGDHTISKMEIEADEKVNAADLSDAEKEESELQQGTTTTLVTHEFGDSDKTLAEDTSVRNKEVDHETSSCKENDGKFSLDKDMVPTSGEMDTKPGETEGKIDSTTNKDVGVVPEIGNLSEEENRRSAQKCEPISSEDVSHKLGALEDQDKPPAEKENDCCKNDGKTDDVANEKNCASDGCGESDYLVEPRQSLAEVVAVSKLENKSKVLEENNIAENEPEMQTKLTLEVTSSVKADQVVNQKQLLEDKIVSGNKFVSCEILESKSASKKADDTVNKPDGRSSEKTNIEANLTGTDANTDDKCNGQEILPDATKRTETGEAELKPEKSDASFSSQDVCVGKSDVRSENSLPEVNDEQGNVYLEGDGTTECQGDHAMQTEEKSIDKEKTACNADGLMDTPPSDKKQVEVVTTTAAGSKEATPSLSCNKSQLKREPRAKMTLSPNRMMGKQYSFSSPPAETTSFGASRNKLAAARKTLVNLVSKKGWCSILRQSSKSEDSVSSDNNTKVNSSKGTDKKPASGSTRLTLVKGADGKQFLIKTPTEGSLPSSRPTGQVVKQVILVSNPSGVTLGGASSKEVESKTSAGKTGVISTPGKENSCLLPPPSTTHKLPVQKARKSAHQTARKAQIAAYESYNINNKAHTLNPFANMTIKVPDLENALGIKQKSLNKLDAKTLDKILLDNVQRAIKKRDTTLHKTPIPVSSMTSVSTILVGQSILRRKKRRRMGMYKLPDLKKKTNKKSKKCAMIVMHEQNTNDALAASSATDDDPAKSDIQKLLGHLKMKRRKRPKLWACGKVYKAPTKTKTMKTAGVGNTATPHLLQAKLEKLDDDMVTSDGRKWNNSVIGNPPLLDGVEQPSPDDHNSDVIGNRRSQRKRKGTIDEDTWSVTSTAGDSDVSSVSTSRGVKHRRVDSEGGDIPVLLPACTLSDLTTTGTDCLSTPPHISPQKTFSAATWCDGSVSNRVTQSDKMVYTHPLGSLPGPLQQKLKAMRPQQADLPALPSGSLLKFVSTPNGMTFPLSPAKPEDTSKYPVGRKTGHMTSRYTTGEDSDRDFIPLCCCKINGASFANLKQVIYCQALDSIDGKVVGCCNNVTNGQLVRSAVKIPFMAVCEQHRKRLRLHQCCPGCGHFCTQGKFYQCKKEGSMGVHHFHKQCQVFRDNKYYCPHCGAESHQVEVNLKLHDPTKLSLQPRPQRLSTVGPRARMGILSPKSSPSLGAEDLGVSISVRTTSTNKEISTAGMPLGQSRTELENIITLICNDKPKKLRASFKSLYAASYAGEVEKVLAILLDGGDANMQFEEFNKQTALHAAAIGGYLSVVHLLIQAGASLHINDQNLCTAAICAAEYGQTAVVRYLIKAGAIADAKGQDGMTCLHLAAKCGSVDTVKYLVEMTETNVNVKDDGGWTPLIWATESCHLAVVRYMLLVGADPNIRDNEENTGLHWAAYAGCVDVAELFLNAGCCLEAANEHGDRPLHIAARQDHYECIVLFLARGADSEARNNNNNSAISCCVDQNGHVWMALRVNKQLKGFATQRLHQPEQLLYRDISMGREANPLPVVNGVDDENYPTDFQYLMNNAETSPMNINHVITSLQCCQCRDNCCSTFCICSRNSVKCWYDKEGRLLKDFNYMDPPLIFECNKACSCWANCRNRVIQLGITSRLQVFRTNGRGWGVRTLLNIPQGTFVCEYVGELISDTVADNREDDSYLFDLDNKESDTYCIDARLYGNVSRFINHLCEPNLLPVKVFVEHQDLRFPRMCFFATRDIKANEELGFDYGEKFWIIKWKHFTCTCGSAKCKYSATTIHQTISDYNQRMAEDNAVLN